MMSNRALRAPAYCLCHREDPKPALRKGNGTVKPGTSLSNYPRDRDASRSSGSEPAGMSLVFKGVFGFAVCLRPLSVGRRVRRLPNVEPPARIGWRYGKASVPSVRIPSANFWMRVTARPHRPRSVVTVAPAPSIALVIPGFSTK